MRNSWSQSLWKLGEIQQNYLVSFFISEYWFCETSSSSFLKFYVGKSVLMAPVLLLRGTLVYLVPDLHNQVHTKPPWKFSIHHRNADVNTKKMSIEADAQKCIQCKWRNLLPLLPWFGKKSSEPTDQFGLASALSSRTRQNFMSEELLKSTPFYQQSDNALFWKPKFEIHQNK